MLTVDQYEYIRIAHRVYGKRVKQIARETGHSKNTIKKILRGQYVGYVCRQHQPYPVLAPYMATIDKWLSDRFRRERPHLNVLPRLAFDTSYRVYRRVYKDCTARFEGNSYVVAHDLVGRQIILRVKDKTMRIFANDRLVVTYETPEGKGHLVQDPRFYAALRKDREMNRRKYGSGRRIKGQAKYTISPSKPQYAMDVEVRPLFVYDQLVGEVRP